MTDTATFDQRMSAISFDEMARRVEEQATLRRAAHAGELFVSVPEGMRERDFEAAGCSMIDACGFLLAWVKAEPTVRHTCLVIAGLSGGDYHNFSEITQASMAHRMGCSLPTMRERLQELWDWQQRENRCFVEIEKRDYDPDHGKYQTTRYRPLIVRYASLFVRKLSEKNLRPVNRQQAISEGTEKVYDEVTVEVVEEMPEAPLLVNRKPKREKVRQREIGFIEQVEMTLRRDLHKWCDRMERSDYLIKDHAPALEAIMHEVLRERGQSQLERVRSHKAAMKNINSDISRKVKLREQTL